MENRVRYSGCAIASMDAAWGGYGMIENGAIIVANGKTEWVGRLDDAPDVKGLGDDIDLGGRLVTPALIDCHTHLVFGGNRADEFEMRLNNLGYEEIARRGGGIKSTVKATRQESIEGLVASARVRLDALIAEGVGVVEIKSGYGLTIDEEIKMLRATRRLAEESGVKILTTWLAAHALPPEYEGRAEAYIDDVAIEGMKKAQALGLIDAVDGYCERIGFTRDQVDRLFHAASSLGLPIKLHAEQFSDQKGALLAANHNGLSADHLEYLEEGDVKTFAASGAVAVLLPGAYYVLREKKLPPIEALRQHKVDIAIATDCNPGSSPVCSILTVMNMACNFFGLTPEEALAGVTRNAAKALGLAGDYGAIKKKARANFAVWNIDHPAELSYWVGKPLLHKNIDKGVLL